MTHKYINIDVDKMAEHHSKLMVYYLFLYYNDLKQQGLLDYAFHECQIKEFKNFMGIACDPHNRMFLVCEKDSKPCAHIMLSGFYGKVAMAHFAVLRPYHGKRSVTIARESLTQIFSLSRGGGSLVECLVGITPKRNKLAIRFAMKVGFVKTAVLPEACYMAVSDEYEDGVMTVLKRSVLDGWW
jgi:hypothetical protein